MSIPITKDFHHGLLERVPSRGVPENDVEAVRWFRLAADQGDAFAQYILGISYDNGQGVPQDFVEAHKWFNLAAAQSSGEDRDRWVENRDIVAAKMTPSRSPRLSASPVSGTRRTRVCGKPSSESSCQPSWRTKEYLP